MYKTFAIEEQIVGEWQVLCSVHHMAADDPIIFPNGFGKSHMHSFYGNVTTNAATTTESLMANRSNCGRNMETTDRPCLQRKGSAAPLNPVAVHVGMLLSSLTKNVPAGQSIERAVDSLLHA